jgi:hypothetical protein
LPAGFGPAALASDYRRQAMSTRRLIIAAVLCGVAILVAFAVQITQVD